MSRKLIFALGFLAILLAGVALWSFRTQRPFSDPHALRKSPAYENALLLKASSPPPVPASFGKAAAIQRTNDTLQFDLSGTPAQWDTIYNFQVHKVPASQTIKVGGGSVSLRLIGVAYPEKPILTNWEYEVNVPAKWFHIDMTPVSPEEAKKTADDSSAGELGFTGTFPTAEFVFTRTNLPEIKFMGAAVFNAETHQELTSGYASSTTANSLWFRSAIGLWHQAPLEIVLGLAVGPAEMFALKGEEGSKCHLPIGEVYLAGIAEGHATSWGTDYRGGTNSYVRIRLDTSIKETTFIMTCWPSASSLPIDFEFRGPDGKKLDGGSSGSSGQLQLGFVRGKKSDVSEIRIKYYPNIKKLVFRLPELPGLPERNRNLQNLFDAFIPYFRMENAYQYNYTLGKLVGMDVLPGFAPRDGEAPLVHTNVTPNDLLKYLDSAKPEGQEIYVDSKNQKIEHRPPLFIQLWEKLKAAITRK
jgi:hypothetical protein